MINRNINAIKNSDFVIKRPISKLSLHVNYNVDGGICLNGGRGGG